LHGNGAVDAVTTPAETTAVETMPARRHSGASATSAAVGVGVATLLTVGSGIVVSYGLAEHERLWLFLGAGIFAPVLVIATGAAADRVEVSRRAAAAVAFCGLVVLFVIAIVVSSSWWSDSPSRSAIFTIASADPSAHVYLHRFPGSSELSGHRAPAPLVAGKHYVFTCEVRRNDGSRWARLDGTSYWAPVISLRTALGTVPARLPTC
jgi:hypothetical protein